MEPVQGVTVGMIPEGRGRGAGPTATSDEAGKFRFANVPPGRYELVAPSAKPQALTLGRGQSLKDLRVQISGPLTISGRVLDENGAPVARAFVMATQPTYLPTGRVLRPCQAAQNARIETDDRGEYRLYGLEPGSYYVTVALKGPLVIGISGTPMPEASCITAFYPSAIDPAEAVPVVLKPGLDATGIDFRLRKIPLYVAKFKVVTAPGFTTNPALPPQITIARLGRNGVRATLQQGGIGTFEGDTYTSPALPEGSYELEYSKGRALAINTARIRFTIIDRDVDAGTITMYPSVTVFGEIKTEVRCPRSGGCRMCRSACVPWMSGTTSPCAASVSRTMERSARETRSARGVINSISRVFTRISTSLPPQETARIFSMGDWSCKAPNPRLSR
jgi:hypothetical protein